MNLLALDTGTEYLSIALRTGEAGSTRVVEHHGPGGAKASTDVLAAVQRMVEQAGLRFNQLDAICFGSGPGSFTGLRTACSVVQGLAFGADVPVLPVDSLLAVAEDARWRAAPHAASVQVTALLDARMDEMYVGEYLFTQGHWQVVQPATLLRPQDLHVQQAHANGPHLLAGNVFEVYANHLRAWAAPAQQRASALPTAAAMLRMAPAMLAQGLAVDAALAMPRYIRDKVAKTTAEREAEKAAAHAVAAL
ncbi:MAG: tRNA (adenosine(37)-N6)-threonylcarbamoyltransferase complex dimerization subunit type 1 TsaB [Rhodoferax sp.]|nr:tRNA (adenosine(37)-N6)-threonylcarbamoyltransferase complex dimerization subunit type 1 TsaB [Rhodoferax sp.]